MRHMDAKPNPIVRAMVLVLALPVLAACTVVEMQIGAAPFPKIKGTVTTPFGGHASGCELELSDIRDGKQFASFDVSGRFIMRYSTSLQMMPTAGRIRARCFTPTAPTIRYPPPGSSRTNRWPSRT